MHTHIYPHLCSHLPISTLGHVIVSGCSFRMSHASDPRWFLNFWCCCCCWCCCTRACCWARCCCLSGAVLVACRHMEEGPDGDRHGEEATDTDGGPHKSPPPPPLAPPGGGEAPRFGDESMGRLGGSTIHSAFPGRGQTPVSRLLVETAA
jgi:hypothetical protein